MLNSVIHGDCLDILKTLDADSVDVLCTDPPYALNFMNLDFDKAVPSVEIWKECLRVLKPGAFAFIMSSPRQDCLEQMLKNIREAGFNTNFTSLYWTYLSGFPKAMNVGRAIDRKLGVESEVIATITTHDIRNNSLMEARIPELKKEKQSMDYQVKTPTSELGKQYKNAYAYYQPKPALECILVCMKPIVEKNSIEQVLKNGKGVTWLGNCRIPHNEEVIETIRIVPKSDGTKMGLFAENTRMASPNPAGRFPANVLISDESFETHEYFSLDKWAEERKIVEHQRKKIFVCSPLKGVDTDMNDMYDNIHKAVEYSKYVIDCGHIPITPHLYFTQMLNDDEPAERMLGMELGLELMKMCDELWVFGSRISEGMKREIDEWNRLNVDAPIFLNIPKVAPSERDLGCEDLEEKFAPTIGDGIGLSPMNAERGGRKKNINPCVKPLALMSYLITLGSQPHDVVLDPFCGSGSTLMAAKRLNRKYIGIEKDIDYFEIAKCRVGVPVQPSLFDF